MTEESKIGAKRKIKLCSRRLMSQTVGHDTDAKSARITVRAPQSVVRVWVVDWLMDGWGGRGEKRSVSISPS